MNINNIPPHGEPANLGGGITNPDKLIYPDQQVTKHMFIEYLLLVSKYILPYLENRPLTLIRYPHGFPGESFFQKKCPSYAPDFIITNNQQIICNDVATLLWLGNQLALEYHVPFETIKSAGHPTEIVFDLDPPSIAEFPLAIKAACMLKEVLDEFGLTSFVKTSGNKGLQVYIPFSKSKYSYEETRRFTYFIAEYLVAKEPDAFTTKRFKKERGQRLYVDYVQHAPGKTIIAPYSPRGNSGAWVAAPLYWDKVTAQLHPSKFTLKNMPSRLQTADPWAEYFTVLNESVFDLLLKNLSLK